MTQNQLHFFIPIKIFQATGMYFSLVPLCIWDQKQPRYFIFKIVFYIVELIVFPPNKKLIKVCCIQLDSFHNTARDVQLCHKKTPSFFLFLFFKNAWFALTREISSCEMCTRINSVLSSSHCSPSNHINLKDASPFHKDVPFQQAKPSALAQAHQKTG